MSEIYSASATAVGASIKLSGAIISGGDTTNSWDVTPNGQRVVFIENKDNATLTELYSAPVNAANAAVKISDPAAVGSFAATFALCPNSTCVAYVSVPNAAGNFKNFSTTTTAPVLVHVSAPVGTVTTNVGSSSTATSFRANGLGITPDSRRVLWTDNRNSPSKSELFSAAIGGGTLVPPVAISGSMVENAQVLGVPVVSADSATILFVADKDTDGVVELYAVAPDAGGAILDIDGDGVVLPTTDGLMLTRWQLGIRGAALFGGIAFSGSATRTTAVAIEEHLRRLTETGLAW